MDPALSTAGRWRWRALAQRIGNPLDWTPVGKCGLLAALNFALYAGNAGQLHGYAADPALVPFLDHAFVRQHVSGLVLICVGWLIILGAALWLRRSRPNSRALVYSTVALYCVDSALAVYFVGPFTSPMVMLLFGAPLIAFVLFEQRVAFTGVAITYAVLALTIGAERMGLVPYAPLLAEPPYDGTRPADAWAAAMGMQIFGLLTFNVLIVAYIVAQWRDRETKLAVAYEELQQTQDQLVRAESLASIGSLVTGAAHELRNPLGSSGAMLQSLAEDLDDPRVVPDDEAREDAGQTLRFARQGHARAGAIVERLYDLSDQLDYSDQSVPVSRIVEYLRGAYPDVAFEVTRVSDRAVPERACRTILGNLIENALASESASPVRVGLVQQGEEMTWTVADEGCGIPASERDAVFRPFHTSQKGGAGHGVGLGLYIVHQLVSRLGGQIDLTGAEGSGTTVSISLPVA